MDIGSGYAYDTNTSQPPHSDELESYVLMEAIGNPVSRMTDIISVLGDKPDHFYYPVRQKIYGALVNMYRDGIEIDNIALYEHGKRYGLKDKEVKYALTQRTGQISGDVRRKCLLLVEYTMRRELRRLGYKMWNGSVDMAVDVFKMLSEFSQAFDGIYETNLPNTIFDASKIYDEAMEKIREAMENKGVGGIRTGFPHMDKDMYGFLPGELVYVAARPSVGKSAFCTNVQLNAALNGTPSLFFSYEMTRESIMNRILSIVSGIDVARISTGRIEKKEYAYLQKQKDLIDGLDIYISDSPSITMETLRANVQQHIRSYGIQAVFVDYIQLIPPPKAFSRERELAMISKELKNLTQEFNLPIIVASQLNRRIEQRDDADPVMSDLKDSGALEQDADKIMFLKRKVDNTEDSRKCNVILRKNRNGPVGDWWLRYQKERTLFTN